MGDIMGDIELGEYILVLKGGVRMQSIITLGIDKMEIDWGKYDFYREHSALFQPSDVQTIPYYYLDSDGNLIEKMQEGYSKPLTSVKKRLNLLGYDIASIRNMFNQYKREYHYRDRINLSFEQLYSLISKIDTRNFNTMEVEIQQVGDFDLGEYVYDCILENEEIEKHLFPVIRDEDEYIQLTNKKILAEFLENLDPYIILRILAENPHNTGNVNWYYADAIENGFGRKEDLTKPLSHTQQIILVTEGSSDTYILKKTIEALYPDIADFFDFIDTKEGYPFTGTGNLYNFCIGLTKIGIQNQIIAIFDNDTAGLEKFKQSCKLNKPESFLILTLPNHTAFESFDTVGPHGVEKENINGRAVAIECFLDFKSVNRQPLIQWTSYNHKEAQYQGELVKKEAYVEAFKKASLTDGHYDITKLRYLMDYIIGAWINRKACIG